MASEVFPSQRRNTEHGSQLSVWITCRKCHRKEWAVMKATGLAPKVFRQRGWLIGSGRQRDVCPGCRNQTEKRPNMTSGQRRAAYNAIEERLDRQEAQVIGLHSAAPEAPPIFNTVMADALAPVAEAMKSTGNRGARRVGLNKGQTLTTGFTRRYNAMRAARTRLGEHALPGEHYKIVNEAGGTFGWEPITQQEGQMAEPIQTVSGVAVNPPPVPAAAPPRTPTPVENRRVLDAMDAHYDADRQLYRGSFTDEAVAQQLKVPRAWVTKVRADFYGPETNEAALMRGAKLDDAIKLAEAATQTLLDMAQKAEALATDLKRAREAL